MIKTSAFLILIALRLMYQPSAAQQDIPAFSGQQQAKAAAKHSPVTLISVSGFSKNNKTVLEWVVGDNQTADLFEVEKSDDGKEFKLAAIVFGSDTPEKASYSFFEPTGKQKQLYRVKLVSKNKKAVYSPVVEITPGV